MTIYVDNAGIPADVADTATGRSYKSRWCHLFSDNIDQTELHEFAARISLKRAWFQPGKALGRPGEHDPAGDHYDLTAGKRRQAVAAGAVDVDLHQAAAVWSAKRDLVHTQKAAEVQRPVLSVSSHTQGGHTTAEGRPTSIRSNGDVGGRSQS